jgi:23S rRNA (adenine2503-C2)-methyltransferase
MTANLLDFDLDGLAVFCERLGEKRFRATQLFRWIHQKGAQDFDQMTDLAEMPCAKSQNLCAGSTSSSPISQHDSADGTIKWLFDVGDRQCRRDRVHSRDDRGPCASHPKPVVRSICLLLHRSPRFQPELTTGEIIAQLWFAEHTLRQKFNTTERVISNVVMMGMGEALAKLQRLGPCLARDVG